VLAEWVFALPGFFRHTKRAIGQAVPQTIDIPALQALALWAAMLIVVTSSSPIWRSRGSIRASARPLARPAE